MLLPQLSSLPDPPLCLPSLPPVSRRSLGLPPPALCYASLQYRHPSASQDSSLLPCLGTSVVFQLYASSLTVPQCQCQCSPHPNSPQPPNFPLPSALPFPLFLFFYQTSIYCLAIRAFRTRHFNSEFLIQLSIFFNLKPSCLGARERLKRRNSSASPAATKSRKKSKSSHSLSTSCIGRVYSLVVAFVMRLSYLQHIAYNRCVLSRRRMRWYAPQGLVLCACCTSLALLDSSTGF